ncbi:acyltransferase domain-containing protein [Plantactinospora sp. GCM10030261]|uniref:acyltransferase domain-containing protein n=1 Tax=Plantactinospora sp. GCM10030261 TaxID=3273420 RepID=UPI00362240BE
MNGSYRQPHLLVLSADTPGELDAVTDELAAKLTGGADLADVAAHLRTMPELPYRRMVVAVNPARAAQHLQRRDPRHTATEHARPERPVVFLFSGVGDHYVGLGAGLARVVPRFRHELTRCLRAMTEETGIALAEVLYPAGGATSRERSLAQMLSHDDGPVADIHRTIAAQPLLFATQYAMAVTLQAFGVRPAALCGYSIGEYVAACIAGVLPLDDALRLVARRACLVADLPGGGMLAVAAAPGAIAAAIDPGLVAVADDWAAVDGRGAFEVGFGSTAPLRDGVAVAALNGPALTVLSGPVEALAAVAATLATRGIASQRLSTSHAFHSPMMDPVVEPLRNLIATIPLREPQIPLLCNGTGGWMGAEAIDPGYWAGHLRNPVRFADNVAQMWSLDDPILVELGPGAALTRLAAQHPARPLGCGTTAITLPGPLEKRPDLVVLLTACGRLWAAGCPIAIDAL